MPTQDIKEALIVTYGTKDEADEAQQALQNLRMGETPSQELAIRVKSLMRATPKDATASVVESSVIHAFLRLLQREIAREVQRVPHPTLDKV